jgi:NADH:ubiquinone oxidoreductase subunit 5 (subunit L)/multisubunit Na+/H+ antiporter MnhA subunit
MEAPVPASALIHSATLVSAGIYLLMRFNYLFLYSPTITLIFLLITSFTALFGAIIASYQTDVKKILAYSTISHCGFLMVSLMSFNPTITLLYLFGHGFFKSLNFMCIGNLINYVNNYQDFRKMGGINIFLLFEFFVLFICILNLGSLPFFLNFFSKHFLLNFTNLNNFAINIIHTILYFAAFFGIFYSIKVLYYTFLTFKKSHYSIYALKTPVTNTFLTLLFNTSKLNICSLVLLFCFTCLILSLYMYIIYLNLTPLNDLTSTFVTINLQSISTFFIKILFFYVYLNILYLFLTFKSANIFVINYLWVYYL